MKVYVFLATHIIALSLLLMGSVFPFAGATAQYMWMTTSPPSGPVASAAVATNNSYIYVIDGSSYGYAPIMSDGTLGTWTSFLIPSIGNRTSPAAIGIGNYIYLSGGLMSIVGEPITKKDVYRFSIDLDGSLSVPIQENSMNNPHASHVHVYSNSYLYAIDGSNVEYTQINPEGSLGAWLITNKPSTTNLTTPPSFAWVSNGFMYYCYPAYINGNALQIERAFINLNGSLGSWQILTTITSSTVIGEYVGVSTGIENTLLVISSTGSIQQTPILANGVIGIWTPISAQFVGNRRNFSNNPIGCWGRFIYVVGVISGGVDTQVLLGFTNAPLYREEE